MRALGDFSSGCSPTGVVAPKIGGPTDLASLAMLPDRRDATVGRSGDGLPLVAVTNR